MQIMFPVVVQRGPHAYGWMYSQNGDIYSHVAEGRADTKQAVRSMGIPNDVKWWVGHVRWATHGDPAIMSNNHPIQHGSIIGVHNGIITNYTDILEDTGRSDDTREVDSEAIFAAVDKWGHSKGLEKIKGQMVAVYADARFPDTLRIARTDGRPLIMCKTPTGAIVFASMDTPIEATGIEHLPFTNVSTYRLLTLKGGLITRRQDIPHAANQYWHRPHYSAANASFLRTPRVQKMLDSIAEQTQVPSSTDDPPHRGRLTRTPSQNARKQKDGTYDGTTGLYWYNGLLVDLDTYIDSMVGEMSEELDNSAQKEHT